MLVLGTGRGSNYANRDILERTILKKKKRVDFLHFLI